MFAGHSRGEMCVIPVNEALTFEGDKAQIVTVAEFSDATVLEVTGNEGVVLHSIANTSIRIAGRYAQVPVGAATFNNGTVSPLVHAYWTPGCSTAPIANACASLSVKMPPASAVIVDVYVGNRHSSARPVGLTRPGDAASISCMETQARFEITLVYPGRRQRMTADARTVLTFANNSGLSVDRSQGNIVVTTAPGAPVQTSTLRVAFLHEAVSADVRIQVVVFSRFVVGARPLPAYTGSGGVDSSTLRLIQHTSPPTYEQATLTCAMKMSTGAICTTLPGVKFTLEPPMAAVSLTGAVVAPSNALKGNAVAFDAHCNFGSVQTSAVDKLQMQVLTPHTRAYITSSMALSSKKG